MGRKIGKILIKCQKCSLHFNAIVVFFISLVSIIVYNLPFSPPKHCLSPSSERLYQDYLDMRSDKQPGEEYDLIEWWSEELMLQPSFALEKKVGQEGKAE